MKKFLEKLTFKQICILSFLTGVFAGCQTVPYQGRARDVRRKIGAGGIIAVPLDPKAEDRRAADEKMRSTCGDAAVSVLEEGEVVTGTKSTQNESIADREDTRRKNGKFLGMNVVTGEAGGYDTKTSSTTEQLKEWQISYECVTSKKR